jgi:AraC-like DNA-binding protein
MSREIPQWFINEWRNIAFVVDGIYAGQAKSGNQSRGGARDYWTYVTVTDGRLHLRQGSWTAVLGPGDQTVLLPDSPFTRQVVSATCRWVNIDFRVQATGLGANPLPALGLPALVHTPVTPARVRLLADGLATMESASPGIFTGRGIADQLVGQYLQQGIVSGAIVVTQREPLSPWLNTVRLQLAENFRRPDLDIVSIARASGFSRSHFDRSFKKAFGATPMEFLWEQRLQMAVRKLDTDPFLAVAVIAAACGFKSHSHFTRLFRQRFEMTPKQWRQRRRLPDSPSLQPASRPLR